MKFVESQLGAHYFFFFGILMIFIDIQFYIQFYYTVASWLVRSSPDRAVRVRALARGHCVVFLGKTRNSDSASLHPGV